MFVEQCIKGFQNKRLFLLGSGLGRGAISVFEPDLKIGVLLSRIGREETIACIGEVAFQKSQLDEWMKPVEAPMPRVLAAAGHRGIIIESIVGPFKGPPLLLLRPAIKALAAGNCCVLKQPEGAAAVPGLRGRHEPGVETKASVNETSKVAPCRCKGRATWLLMCQLSKSRYTASDRHKTNTRI
jgi:hypothetical protein